MTAQTFFHGLLQMNLRPPLTVRIVQWGTGHSTLKGFL
jgi:hypothetical protein